VSLRFIIFREAVIHMFSPLDLTKVRLQASGDKRMVESIKKTVNTAGVYQLLSYV